jgi:hypothetical protein
MMPNRNATVLWTAGFGGAALLAGAARPDLATLFLAGVLFLILVGLDLLLREKSSARAAALLPAAAAAGLVGAFLRDSILWLLPVFFFMGLWALGMRRPSPRRALLLPAAVLAFASLALFLFPPPRDLPGLILAGHLALAAGGAVLTQNKSAGCSDDGTIALPLDIFFWLAFHTLGLAMVVMKFYPVPAFLPFIAGVGASLYSVLARSEASVRPGRTQALLFAAFGLILLGDRLIRAVTA